MFSIDDLLLDPQNPRLPVEVQEGSPDELLKYIASHYEPLEIGRSIARHGYFPSEPIIVVEEDGEHVVVEGNRRIAALLLLADPDKAAEFELEDAIEWASLASERAISDCSIANRSPSLPPPSPPYPTSPRSAPGIAIGIPIPAIGLTWA